MKIEDQVCSFELSKQLKELKIKQQSLFYYMEHFDGNKIFPVVTDHDREIFNILVHDVFPPSLYSAFTVAELGEILFQKNYENLEDTGYLDISTEMIDRSGGYYYRITNNLTDHIIDEFNEADGRAKMLIFLFKQGLIK